VKLLYTKLVRWAFERFYCEFSWTYDAVAALVSAGFWRDWTLAALPWLRGQVLELGFGTGNVQCALARDASAPFVVGLDASWQMVRHTLYKADRAHVRVRLLRGNARALPFAAASFDTLLATFPSEYIAASETLAEARRVLRPSGRLVILLGAQLSSTGVYERLVELAYRLTLQASPRTLQPSAAPNAPGMAPFSMALQRALSDAGFTVQSQWVAAPGGHVLFVIGEARA
jgi:ubiquinone/menaquinone biosynthesis C-methylase UbiE